MMKKNNSKTAQLSDEKILEAFRLLTTNIDVQFLDTSAQFAVVAPHKGWGTSTVTAGLARAWASQGKKVLLVEETAESGEVKIDGSRIVKNIQKTDIFNLYNLDLSVLTDLSAWLTKDFATFFESVSKKYDIVLFDSAALLEESTSLQLLRQVPFVISVVKTDKIYIESALKAKRMLDLANVKIIGAIVNDQ
jgi:Mrp family chromosome partitioning ATPase